MKTLTRTHTTMEHRETNEQAPKRHREDFKNKSRNHVKLYDKEWREDGLKQCGDLLGNFEKCVSCKRGP